MFNRIIGGQYTQNTSVTKQEHYKNNANKRKEDNSLLGMLKKRQHPDMNTPQFQKKQKLNDGDAKEKFHQSKNEKKHIEGQEGKRKGDKKKEKGLQNRIEEDLVGSKFRMINECFYTNDSQTSASHFAKNKEDFLLYHKGFQIQTEKWSIKPVDMIIKEIETNKFYEDAVIADLGCGDGKIFEHFQSKDKIKSLNSKATKGVKEIHSFDLCSHKDFIKVADSKNIPLSNSSCDVVVFCLALMGTNYIEFLNESRRLLKKGGHLIVSEVNSRITDMNLFVGMIESIGFTTKKNIQPNSYFCFLVFEKRSEQNVTSSSKFSQLQSKEFKSQYQQQYPNTKESTSLLLISQQLLKPCIYKKR